VIKFENDDKLKRPFYKGPFKPCVIKIENDDKVKRTFYKGPFKPKCQHISILC
jgi:hypothetical protein